MKKYKNLFLKICSYENFLLAYLNAIKRKRWYREVVEIEKNRDEYLIALADEVREKRYKVSPYTIFKLWSGNKWRDIYKLPMRDRIVLHAIMIYCEPIFRESFIQDTYSSIKDRGIHRGLYRLKRAVKDQNYKYALLLDIRRCYPSLDHNILKDKLYKKFKDDNLQQLFCTIIDSCDKGVPIGNYTSLYFNNFYFNGVDHKMKEVYKIKYYFRYCDDIVILGKTKQLLRDVLNIVKIELHDLNVELKPNYRIYPISTGINFLGYITRKKYIRIRKLIKQNFINKTHRMNLSNLKDKDINILGSYWGILKHADCRYLWRCYTKGKDFKEVLSNGRF